MSRDFIPKFPLPVDPRKQHRSNSHAIWDGSNWDDGRLWKARNKAGLRMIVYRPDYPNAPASGYVRRAWVVWWLATGNVPRKGYDIHHRNENSLDDEFSNLEEKAHGLHSTDHNLTGPLQTFKCLTCKKDFQLRPCDITQRCAEQKRNGRFGKYCSTACYHATKKQWLKNKPNPHTAKLTIEQVREIKAALPFNSYGVLARFFDVSVMTISKIKHGETWRHV